MVWYSIGDLANTIVVRLTQQARSDAGTSQNRKLSYEIVLSRLTPPVPREKDAPESQQSPEVTPAQLPPPEGRKTARRGIETGRRFMCSA